MASSSKCTQMPSPALITVALAVKKAEKVWFEMASSSECAQMSSPALITVALAVKKAEKF